MNTIDLIFTIIGYISLAIVGSYIIICLYNSYTRSYEGRKYDERLQKMHEDDELELEKEYLGITVLEKRIKLLEDEKK